MNIHTHSTIVAIGLVVSLAACTNGTDNAESPTSSTGAPMTVVRPTITAAPTTRPTTTVASESTTAPTATEPEVEPLQILVTNDDGLSAPGIDALVTGLAGLDEVEVTVVAPEANQSGSSMRMTDGELVATQAATLSGTAGTAVRGYPADSVNWAIENLDVEFDLVVSGSNTGQNVGEFSAISGTVGAARFAAQHGFDAVAVSQGLTSDDAEIVFDDTVAATIEWITEQRDTIGVGEVSLVSINSATCPNGNRGVVYVPLASSFDDRDPLAYDCGSTATAPVDDVDAIAMGYTAVTALAIETPPGTVQGTATEPSGFQTAGS